MRTLSLILSTLGFLIFHGASADAQCPSAGYFRLDSTHQLETLDTAVKTTACLELKTRTDQIAARSIVTVDILDTRRLERVLVERWSGAGLAECSLFNLSRWEFTDVAISYAGSSTNPRIRVHATTRECNSWSGIITAGLRVAYEAPLIMTLAGTTVTFRIDPAQARLRFVSGFSVPLVGGILTGKLNSAMGSPIDIAAYIPSTLRDLNPEVTQASLKMQSRHLTLTIRAAGTLTKQTADRHFSETVRTGILPPLLRWLGQPMS